MGTEAVEILYPNGFSKLCNEAHQTIIKESHPHPADDCWYEETIDDDLKWSLALNSVLHEGTSIYQDFALLDTKRFGKVLVIDGKMHSAEVDEFICHECLIHPALLFQPNPKTVFIMGGGEGSAAREALRHKSIEKFVICDTDKEVVNFFRRFLIVNQEAFSNKKLNLVINNAKRGMDRAELEKRTEKFDVIVGDLVEPVEGGPCYQLYTKSFYEKILKPKLNHNGIFVTQAGPAGIFTHKEVFSSNTIQSNKCSSVDVKAYTAHVPSFADTWGWVMASDQPFSISAEENDNRIAERVGSELLYLSGASFISSSTMNKTVYLSLLNETHVYTEEDARFLPGHGVAYHH